MGLGLLSIGGVEKLNFVFALILLISLTLVAELLKRFMITQLERSIEASKRSFAWSLRVQNTVLSILHRTYFIAELLWFAYLIGDFLYLPHRLLHRIERITLIVGILQVSQWSIAIVHTLVDSWMDMRHMTSTGLPAAANESGKAVIRFLAKTMVWALTSLMILENLGINVNTLIAGLGFTTVAVGFATQNIVTDLFSSLSILLDKPFLVGDFIDVGNEMKGFVEYIGVRTTRLKSLTGEMLVIANSDLAKTRLHNYRVMAQRRILFTVNVPYTTAVSKLEKIPDLLKQVIINVKHAQFDRATLLTFGESTLQYEIVYYVMSSDYNMYAQVQQDINLGILRAFEANQISFGGRSQVIYNIPWEQSPFTPKKT
jgi:small-conductance mechanosensitive channel